jgi:hypothetical protein
MSELNPAGTMFLGLIDALMDLVMKPTVSKIEVIMAGYELDDHGAEKLVNGQHSIEIRPFPISSMNEDVQEKLREEFESAPISHLMILFMERFQNESKMGIVKFGGEQKTGGMSNYDAVEKTAISGYLHRLTK